MPYRKRVHTFYRGGKRGVVRGRSKSAKASHRLRYMFGPSVFNLQWLFGRSRSYRRH